MDEQPKRTRKECARLGGLAISANREHMKEIGRKGGLKVSSDKLWMAEIGRRGGANSWQGYHRSQQQDMEDAAPKRED